MRIATTRAVQEIWEKKSAKKKKTPTELKMAADGTRSPILRIDGHVHGEVAERDLYVKDTGDGVGHQKVPRPRPRSLQGSAM